MIKVLGQVVCFFKARYTTGVLNNIADFSVSVSDGPFSFFCFRRQMKKASHAQSICGK